MNKSIGAAFVKRLEIDYYFTTTINIGAKKPPVSIRPKSLPILGKDLWR
jgi:hypothetical protein